MFLEEISHVELVQHTINQLLTGSGEPTPGNAGIDTAPLDRAVKHANPHHFIVGLKVHYLMKPMEWILGI